MRIRNISVEEQIQQVLLYVQRELANIWKENILENLEARELEVPIVGDFLTKFKKEFSSRDNETMKIAELKKVE